MHKFIILNVKIAKNKAPRPPEGGEGMNGLTGERVNALLKGVKEQTKRRGVMLLLFVLCKLV